MVWPKTANTEATRSTPTANRPPPGGKAVICRAATDGRIARAAARDPGGAPAARGQRTRTARQDVVFFAVWTRVNRKRLKLYFNPLRDDPKTCRERPLCRSIPPRNGTEAVPYRHGSRPAAAAEPFDVPPRAERQAVLAAVGLQPLGDGRQLGPLGAQRHEQDAAAVDLRKANQVVAYFGAIGLRADDELELAVVLGIKPPHDAVGGAVPLVERDPLRQCRRPNVECRSGLRHSRRAVSSWKASD